MIDKDRLGEYLNDHTAGAVGAIAMLQHRLEEDPDPRLSQVLQEIRADKAVLDQLMADLDLTGNPLKAAAAWAGEKVSRIKREVERLRGSALAQLLELEMLQLGIAGKRSLWILLQGMQDVDPRIAALPLDDLIGRADEQAQIVETARIEAGRAALTT
ncbi:MAG TPA: hypothetical protein VMM13_17555 [Euzebya sp.]|nr:hypothetical protein [Euzebya sp.]